MRALAIYATASVLALPLAATAAPDCDGGRVYSLRLRRTGFDSTRASRAAA